MEWYQWLTIIDIGTFAILVVDLLIWWLCIHGKHNKLFGAIVTIAINVVVDITVAFSGFSDIWLVWLWSATASFSVLFGLWQPHGIRGILADRRSRNKSSKRETEEIKSE
jgi:hypothetical protein